MTARDSFWYIFAEMAYRNYYLINYKQKTQRIVKFWDGFILMVSTTSIAAWTIWGKLPYVWAALTAISQIASLLKPSFGYAEQLVCINFCIPELDKIVNEMNDKWRMIDYLEDGDILKECSKFEKRYSDLDAKYITPFYFPERKSCLKKAMKQRDAFLATYYPINQESEVLT